MPYVWGGSAIVILWLLTGIFAGTWNPLKVCEGADGRLSTSKFQWLCWIVVVFFGYVALYAHRAASGNPGPLEGIPDNLLFAIGFSTTTMAAAKGITGGYVSSGRLRKPDTAVNGVGDLMQDDGGTPELVKIQMLAWTFLSLTIYLMQVGSALGTQTPPAALPDLDATLMALMGLSQAGYLGKKLVTMSEPVARP
jgi:hypothetical protein